MAKAVSGEETAAEFLDFAPTWPPTLYLQAVSSWNVTRPP